MLRVLVWSERTEPERVYPRGINGEIAAYLDSLPGIKATVASINDRDQGLSEFALKSADVLIWWAHGRHKEVTDAAAERVAHRVRDGGMGFIGIHSAHPSKPMQALLGASGRIGNWREGPEPEHLTVLEPAHPIARGIRDFTLPETEVYDEPFDIPEPEAVIFHSKWDKGEQFRSGCAWTVGKGRVFYFRPGHETYHVLYNPNVQRILRNACFWAGCRTFPGLETVLLEGAAPEKLAEGFQFTEGPVWSREGFLLFSDIPGDTIYKWTPDGDVSVHRQPSGNSNGLTLDHSGRLIACEHGTRRVTLTEPDGTIIVVASEYKNKRLNSPNDVVVAQDGSIYFTDPPYGIDIKDREQPVNGVYRMKDGKLSLLADDFDRPNGLIFSPNQKLLYIDDSGKPQHVRRFDVLPDGTLSGGKVFADLRSDDPGSPDGMKVDVKGNLWVAGPGGVWVFNGDGMLLGIIQMPEVPANLAFGNADGKMLYITARTGLYRMPVKVEGIRP